MIIFQEVISSAGAGKYPIPLPNGAPLASFDFHNDSPYNCAFNFGQDVGYQASEYYIPPHGIVLGVKAPASGISVGKSFTGTIYLYVATPLGGGVVLAAAPAQQFTVLGYQTGMAPAATVTMSRMQNQGNSSQVGNVTTNIVNDGATAGASLIEAKVAGDTTSAVTLTNDAQQVLGNSARPGLLDVTNPAGDHMVVTGDGIGLPSNHWAFIDTRTPQTGIYGLENLPGDGVLLGGAGVGDVQVDQNGLTILKGNLNLPAGIGVEMANPTTQTLVNGSTITIPGAFVRVNNAGAVTGIIMTAGSAAGQLLYLYNEGTGSLTFAAAGSHVTRGSNVVVQPGQIVTLIWDGVSQWANSII